jgi:hypothetical protein
VGHLGDVLEGQVGVAVPGRMVVGNDLEDLKNNEPNTGEGAQPQQNLTSYLKLWLYEILFCYHYH